MEQPPYYNLMDQICRSNGWVLGSDKGQMVLGVPQGGGQISVVIEDFSDTSGQPAIRMWSPVATADKVPADQALSVNAQLPHGCLADRDGQIVMTVTRVLNMTSQADLTNVIQVITYYADFYGKHYASS